MSKYINNDSLTEPKQATQMADLSAAIGNFLSQYPDLKDPKQDCFEQYTAFNSACLKALRKLIGVQITIVSEKQRLAVKGEASLYSQDLQDLLTLSKLLNR